MEAVYGMLHHPAGVQRIFDCRTEKAYTETVCCMLGCCFVRWLSLQLSALLSEASLFRRCFLWQPLRRRLSI